VAKKVIPGQKFGMLTVMRRVVDDKKTKSPNLKKRVLVKCDCGGSMLTIPVYYLIRKQPAPKTSCGCSNKGLPTLYKAMYSCWYMMNTRCEVETHVAYKHYGGRGISVCERWGWDNPDGFKNFLADMPPRPGMEYSLDRINVNGHYEPGNVKWATAQEQANNQRKNLPKEETSASPSLPSGNLEIPIHPDMLDESL
jgi:hypothetical protein